VAVCQQLGKFLIRQIRLPERSFATDQRIIDDLKRSGTKKTKGKSKNDAGCGGSQKSAHCIRPRQNRVFAKETSTARRPATATTSIKRWYACTLSLAITFNCSHWLQQARLMYFVQQDKQQPGQNASRARCDGTCKSLMALLQLLVRSSKSAGGVDSRNLPLPSVDDATWHWMIRGWIPPRNHRETALNP
jgi:hypothetical protein